MHPLLLAWDDDWEAAGVGAKSVDVALSVRSFSTEHMAACLRKMADAARRRAIVVMRAGYSPRVMPELLAAVGVTTAPNRDADTVRAWLWDAGFMPRVDTLTQERRRTFASRAEARAWGLKMLALCGVNMTGEGSDALSARLDAWLGEHLHPVGQAGENADGTTLGPFALDIPQTITWAIITWECG